MRYDAEFELGANRAIERAVSDLNERVARAYAGGVEVASLVDDLLDDLDSDGPIFGQFFRAVGGAAASATSTASRQGTAVQHAIEDREAQRLLRRFGMQSAAAKAIRDADPEAAEAVEDVTAEAMHMRWIAALRNTCRYCLPLHGIVRTLDEWRRLGLQPGDIHADNGIRNPCYCRLVPEDIAERQKEIMGPLYRVKVQGQKRSRRDILSPNLDRAQKARDDAADSAEGRRMLRKLGQANAGRE